MRLVVTGPRRGYDSRIVYWGVRRLSEVASDANNAIEVLIHGDALGVDRMAAATAMGLGIRPEAYVAEWHKYKRKPNPAGAIRNQQMIDEGQPTYGLVFHPSPDPTLIEGSGTGDMMRRLRQAGIPFLHIRTMADLDLIGEAA